MKKYVKSLTLGVLCLILTIVITIQLRATNTDESKASKTKVTDSLKDQIISLNDENKKLEDELNRTTLLLTQVRSQASDGDFTSEGISELIKRYCVFLGLSDVYGEGLTIKYTPAINESASDIAKDLRYIINELKNVGVEAISINEQRVADKTAIEAVKNRIEINGIEQKNTFIINTIGDSNMVYNGISRPGGIVDVLKASGVQIVIELKDKIEIKKFTEI